MESTHPLSSWKTASLPNSIWGHDFNSKLAVVGSCKALLNQGFPPTPSGYQHTPSPDYKAHQVSLSWFVTENFGWNYFLND